MARCNENRAQTGLSAARLGQKPPVRKIEVNPYAECSCLWCDRYRLRIKSDTTIVAAAGNGDAQ